VPSKISLPTSTLTRPSAPAKRLSTPVTNNRVKSTTVAPASNVKSTVLDEVKSLLKSYNSLINPLETIQALHKLLKIVPENSHVSEEIKENLVVEE
jgi:hypothetical protein